MEQNKTCLFALSGLNLADCYGISVEEALDKPTVDLSYNPIFMNYAVAEANRSLQADDCGPFGACIVLNNVIIGLGYNKVVRNNDPTCHAEVDCIRTACKLLGTYSLKGAVLYSSCEPCPMCLTACKWANIEKVYYANTQQDADHIGFRDQKFYEMFKTETYREWCVHEIYPEAIRTFEKYTRNGLIY